MYCIVHRVNQHEFWSNEFGWTDFEEADYFSHQETLDLNLPVDGRWKQLWEVNCLQFARLIAEAEAIGLWAGPKVMEVLSDDMDLDPKEIAQIISRAQRVFEISKEKLP